MQQNRTEQSQAKQTRAEQSRERRPLPCHESALSIEAKHASHYYLCGSDLARTRRRCRYGISTNGTAPRANSRFEMSGLGSKLVEETLRLIQARISAAESVIIRLSM